jgi:hypothetical protein
MRYLQEQEEWNAIVQRTMGANAQLIHVSNSSSDCRVYRSDSAIFKIRRLTPASIRGRVNTLEDEFLILQRLSSVPAVPKVRGYRREGLWEVLEMDPLAPLRKHDPTLGQPREPLSDFLAVAGATWRINRMGCSHGDLHVFNAGRNVQGGVTIFDFDQANTDHPLRCGLRDFAGIAIGNHPSQISLFARAGNVRFLWPFLRAVGLIQRLLIGAIRVFYPGGKSSDGGLQARVALQGNPALDLLAEAWRLAEQSRASSPDADIAYYSFDICGVHFPGERPWPLRWNSIRKRVDFRGKRLLELGCNLGLLSIHARLEGAVACMGVDVDGEILRAAALTAAGFEVDVEHRQLDLDDPRPWEKEFLNFDMVSALSVMHWVKNKERLWMFLGRFSELLYEGHESESEAEKNLKRAGFTQFERLGLTERNRQVFFASRDS